MIADLLPLLAYAAVAVIARNLFEACLLDHAQRRMEARERVREVSSVLLEEAASARARP